MGTSDADNFFHQVETQVNISYMEDLKQDVLGISDKHGGSFGQEIPMTYIFNRVRVWIEKLLASACKKTTASNKVRFLRCFFSSIIYRESFVNYPFV